MCGIVGAAARRDIVPILIEGLRRLEYRGYDSAGIAVVNGAGLKRVRSAGRVAELATQAAAQHVAGKTGIAHTRWATHGAPTERNAHPHLSGDLAIVHNGIVENYEAIRERLKRAGYEFVSDTDTEVVAHLIAEYRKSAQSLFDASVRAVGELQGAFALAVVSARDPEAVVVARRGPPLLLGLGEGENFAASDVSAVLPVTRRVVYLEDGDCAEIRPTGYRIVDARGAPIERPVHLSEVSDEAVALGPYRHYMQKEIHEQPGALANTLEVVPGAAALQPGRPEFGVASTKAFTRQLAALFLLALVVAKLRGRLAADAERAHLQALRHLPAAMSEVLAVETQVAQWAARFASKEHALFLGRGIHWPIAMEGALKLKEISYIHAEAYAAGELKHGPLALVDRNMPVVAVAPSDALIEKLKSNLQEVRARGGELYVFADEGRHIAPSDGVQVIELGAHAGALSPILHVVPLQLLAYHTALARGTDVDKPRNLAKSVTVE